MFYLLVWRHGILLLLVWSKSDGGDDVIVAESCMGRLVFFSVLAFSTIWDSGVVDDLSPS